MKKNWTIPMLIDAYQSSLTILGRRLGTILEMVLKNQKRFEPSYAKYPTIRVFGMAGQIVTVDYEGKIYFYLRKAERYGGKVERDNFVDELRNLDLLGYDFDPDKIEDGKYATSKLGELDQNDFNEFVSLLEKVSR